MLRRMFPLLLVGLFVLAPQPSAETKTIRIEVRQVFGGSQSSDDARAAAIARAKREALEEAGTYLESLTVVRNAQVKKDELLALANGVLQTQIVTEEPFGEGSALGIRIVAEVRVETSGLEQRVRALLRDRQQFGQLKEVERRTSELLKRVKALEAENARLGAAATEAEKNRLKGSFRAVTRRLTAQEWYEKGLALLDRERRLYEAPAKAVEYFTRAIAFDQEFAPAFNNRGNAYTDLKQHQRAIRDFDRAIELDPANAFAFHNRGVAFKALQQYRRAIGDYDRAIELDPGDAAAFNNRGEAKFYLKEYDQAIGDFDRAIEIDPANAFAFNHRGIAYKALRRYQRAIRDYDRAIELDPRFAFAFANRGYAYAVLKQYQRAIGDFDRAIELDPANAFAFYNRGNAHAKLQQYQRAIRDFDRSIGLNAHFALAFKNRGNAYYFLGERDRACQDWQMAHDLGEENSRAGHQPIC